MPQSWEGLPEKHMKKELESDMMPVLRLRCCYQEAQSLVCESGLRANAVLERDWRARWGLSTASSCWNKPRPGLQLAERALSEVRLEFEIGPIQELWAKRTTSKIHSPHTHTHTHTSKHSSNSISRKDNDLSACPRALPAEVPWGTRVWQTRHIPGFPQCSQVASSSTRQRGAAGTGCSLARVGGCSSSLREETGTPSPPPAHSTKAREQAVAAS